MRYTLLYINTTGIDYVKEVLAKYSIPPYTVTRNKIGNPGQMWDVVEVIFETEVFVLNIEKILELINFDLGKPWIKISQRND